MMEAKLAVSVAILLLVGITRCVRGSEDLLAVETSNLNYNELANLKNDTSQENKKETLNRSQIRNHKYSSRIESVEYSVSTEPRFGLRTTSLNRGNYWKNRPVARRNESRSTTETVLDFRIRNGTDFRENEINSEENVRSENEKKDMATAGSADGKQKKEVNKKEDDDEEKTLSQQVADGKYGLIQNEIFANGSKRPGILSYLSNSEVPNDTRENLGGLEKDEIWLAEDHVLVLKGGRYPEKKENELPSSSVWPPIDDYEAPGRQVKIPKNPKIPPPFPVRLKENGPLELVGGQNGTPPGIPPFFPPFPPPFPLQPNGSLPFPFPLPLPGSPDEAPNGTLPFPFPPGPVPPFLANFPPGAAFLPPPGNFTDFDEDDPSVYYPPKYDFYYPKDNATAVPPGPLVPGIILPPPPDFFAPLEEEKDTREPDEVNETGNEAEAATRPPYIGPNYLPVPRKPPSRHRNPPERHRYADISNGIPDSSPSPAPEKPAVTYVYPENVRRKQTTPSPLESFKTTKVASSGTSADGFSSPIYVPNGEDGFVYHPLPTTSPKPNHITIPTTKSLAKEIYIVTTPEADVRNRIEDSYKKYKGVKTQDYQTARPEIHPLRSLVKPNVSVSYVGKYGHLPASTPFPFPKTRKPVTDDVAGQTRGGHYITHAPNFVEHVVTTPATEVNEITVTPVPVVKKIKIQPMTPSDAVTPSPGPPKATFYFYEEQPSTTSFPLRETSTESPQNFIRPNENEASPPVNYRYPSAFPGKTPIRQYLEETFHSSNVLPNKPGISHANIVKHRYRASEVPKMKHLDYGTPVTVKPVLKYHYVANGDPVEIAHKIKTLEIENSGSSGLQTVRPDLNEAQRDPVAYSVAQLFTSTQRPETRPPQVSPVRSTVSTTSTTPASIVYTNADGPFVPSDYYATAGPDHVHFTPQDHSIVDDITKNYFTVFGQKLNGQSTTPLTPYRRPVPVIATEKPVRPYQPPRKPAEPSLPFYEKPKYVQVPTPAPRPQSHFEQYLTEITGEDQKDYIVANISPNKYKKGKGFPSADVSQTYRPPAPIFLQPVRQNYYQPQAPVPPVKTRYRPPSKYLYRGYPDPSSYVYRPSLSTTLRPVVDVEIRPQYVQHVSSTVGPYDSIRRPTEKVPFDHAFGQYLREITGFTSPTTANPVKIKSSSTFDYFSTTPTPPNQIDYSPSRYPEPQVPPKPVSLEGDILVNYKPQRPEINPDAETISPVPHTVPTYPTGSNFKIVDPPDLSNHRPRPPPRPAGFERKPHEFDAAKDFFENLPKSGYFSPSHPSASNSFISYNLPGNGGHFYFLTPQIVEKSDDEEENESEEDGYRTINRQRKGSEYPSQIQQNPRRGYSNQDYLRRRRKKP